MKHVDDSRVSVNTKIVCVCVPFFDTKFNNATGLTTDAIPSTKWGGGGRRPLVDPTFIIKLLG